MTRGVVSFQFNLTSHIWDGESSLQIKLIEKAYCYPIHTMKYKSFVLEVQRRNLLTIGMIINW